MDMMTHPTSQNRELSALIDLSARIGADPLLIQGPGGNTSVKDGGVLWIKASGTWLSQAKERAIMVPVRLEPLLEAIARGDPACESAVAFVPPELNPQGLRPSIETTLHAVLPDKVVLHLHCVQTIAWAVLADGERQLQELLWEIGGIYVPYERPGLPLAQLIRDRATPSTKIIVMANHGLVVTGDSVAEAAARLEATVSRLRRPARPAPGRNLPALLDLSSGSDYRPVSIAAAHASATDRESLEIAQRGTLYPDHIVFLGAGVFVLADDESLTRGLRRATAGGRKPPPLILVPGKGALIRKGLAPAAEAVAGCLGDVLARLRPEESIRPLTEAQVDAIANWDAEKYRQSLARRAD
jgi:rhamnose utilization protein RhaD (predicted bifunctional aldolase and dehydrogenase)